MKTALSTFTGAVFAALFAFCDLRGEFALSADFEPDGETPFIAPDSIDEYDGWVDLTGDSAVISNAAPQTGLQSLRLLAGDPVAHAVRLGPVFTLDDSMTLWVDFHLRPAHQDDSALTTVSVYGAKIGFLGGNTFTSLYAFDGATQNVRSTGIQFSSGQDPSSGWVHVTLEIFAGFWRMHEGGFPVTDWFGLDGDAGYALHWFGDPSADVFLDNLRVAFGGSENPLESVAKDQGVASDFLSDNGDPVNGRDESSVSLLEDAQAKHNSSSRKEKGFQVMTGGAGTTVFVNGKNGDDANDGLSPARAKATIPSGIQAVPDGGVIVVIAGESSYLVGTLNPLGKAITIKAEGAVIIH